jgi:hypothetical protein
MFDLMDRLRILLARLRAMGRTRDLDTQLDEGLNSHLEHAVQENTGRGMSETEARRAAWRSFGGLTQTREAYRTQRGFEWALHLGQDLRYAARQFQRAPAHTAFTILVLALGIGTVTAMFTIAYAVLLKPLPFPADNLLFQPVDRTTTGEESLSLSYDEINEWQRATNGSADVAFNGGGLNIADGPGGAVLITEVQASPNLFSLLGVKPIIGRGFLSEEQETNHPDVVVLSYALWQQNFSGDPAVLGKTLHIGGILHTVIGVMPANFAYPVYDQRPEAWVPFGAAAAGICEQ